MNVKLLKQVAKAILAHPNNTDMTDWVNHHDHIAKCGTTGCIAGWIVAAANLAKLRKIDTDRDIQLEAIELLDITNEQSWELFNGTKWPAKFRQAWLEATSRKEEAKVIVRRIKHFIKTKGQE